MIKKKTSRNKIEIDLTGPQGNAFFLIGTANKLAKQLDYSKEDADKLRQDMMSGDYENLLSIFDKHFGSFVTLYR